MSKLQKIKKARTKPTPPTHLKSSDLNDWYSQQRQFDLQERKKRDEAELLLRGYRAKYENGSSDKPITPSKSGEVAEGSIETENINVSDEIKKYNSDSILENESSKEEQETDEVSNDEEKKDEVDVVAVDTEHVDETNSTDDDNESESVPKPVGIPDDDLAEKQETDVENVEEPASVEEVVEENHENGEETHVKEEETVVQAENVVEKVEEQETPQLKEEKPSAENATEEDASSIVKEGWRNMIKNGTFDRSDFKTHRDFNIFYA